MLEGKGMKSLQARYSALQGFNFVTTCSACAFVAIFLQYKGLSNTQIGITSAGGCVLSIFLGPVISSLLGSVRGSTIPKVFNISFAAMAALFLAIAWLPVPAVFMMAVYIFLYAMLMSTPPLLSQIAMGYIRRRQSLNFGFARGIGSIAYAVTAVAVSSISEAFSPNAISLFFAVSAAITLVLVNTLPGYTEEPVAVKGAGAAVAEKPLGIPAFAAKYRLLFLVLLGFCLNFVASSALSTYLINIITNLGGDTELFGIATFCMAASELPVMAVIPKLRRKLGDGALVLLAGVAYVLRNCTVVLAPSPVVVFVGLMFQGFSYGTLTSLLAYYISETCGTRDEMTGQTMLAVMTSGVGACAGNLLGGVLQDTLGMGAMFALVVATTLAGSATLIYAGLRMRRITPAAR